ncbi:hypothetical protein HYQ46_011915 [Verticillium longisporum]|nr:hypothetical protein HYQ46_011915 [Verticillium longisporum]
MVSSSGSFIWTGRVGGEEHLRGHLGHGADELAVGAGLFGLLGLGEGFGFCEVLLATGIVLADDALDL